MDLLYYLLLALAAFWLGACPFGVWIGKLLLGRDIRDYRDHNPGAANVFHAGGRWSGVLALILEIGKGAPFVLAGRLLMHYPQPLLLGLGLCPILGHAFSPFLRFRGGKATAVTFGVFLSLPEWQIVAAFVILMVLIYFILEGDGWRIVLSITGTLALTTLTGMGPWVALFLLCVLAIIAAKNYAELRAGMVRKKKITIKLE